MTHFNFTNILKGIGCANIIISITIITLGISVWRDVFTTIDITKLVKRRLDYPSIFYGVIIIFKTFGVFQYLPPLSTYPKTLLFSLLLDTLLLMNWIRYCQPIIDSLNFGVNPSYDLDLDLCNTLNCLSLMLNSLVCYWLFYKIKLSATKGYKEEDILDY